MKKVLSIFIFLGAVVCLTGCGKKASTLACEQETTSFGVKQNLQMVSNFEGNEVKAMSVVYTMDLSDKSDSYVESIGKQDICSKITSSLKSNGYTLTNCHQEIADKQVLITAGVDLSKMDASELHGTPEATKADIEAKGFTCTIK